MGRFEPASKCALYEAEFQSQRNDQQKIGPHSGKIWNLWLPRRSLIWMRQPRNGWQFLTTWANSIYNLLTVCTSANTWPSPRRWQQPWMEIDSYRLAPSDSVTGSVQQPQGELSFIDAIQSKHDTVMDMMQQLMGRIRGGSSGGFVGLQPPQTVPLTSQITGRVKACSRKVTWVFLDLCDLYQWFSLNFRGLLATLVVKTFV